MAFAAAGAEYCDGTVGHGTSDQFQYYLYYGYEAEAVGNPGSGCFWLCVCFYHCFVCVYQAFFFRKIRDGDHLQSLRDGFRLFFAVMELFWSACDCERLSFGRQGNDGVQVASQG